MRSVLIISPKEDEARLISESLPSDYQVQNADSVTNALALNRQCSYDVIFSDLKLLKDTSETDTIADAIKCSDAALYQAKNSGRDQVVRS